MVPCSKSLSLCTDMSLMIFRILIQVCLSIRGDSLSSQLMKQLPGNLLIRSAPVESNSPYNFQIVLLDHGLYFDLDTDLRMNYSKLWLSLMAPASPATMADRRKYAELVGNIGPDLVNAINITVSHYLHPASTPSLKRQLRAGLHWKEVGMTLTVATCDARPVWSTWCHKVTRKRTPFGMP